jgi:hypothetical protein
VIAKDSAVYTHDRKSDMTTRCLKGSRFKTKPTACRTIYNPIGFEPQDDLPLHLHRYADHARYFLHVLYTQRVFKDLDDEFVPLKAAYLRRFFPDNTIYKQVRQALLDSETIICDGVYYQADSSTWRNNDREHRQGKSFGYKLGPKWNGVRHERVTTTTKPLLKSIIKVNKARHSEIVLFPHQHIWRCLQDVTIDHQAAVSELDALMVGASREEIDGLTSQSMICDGISNGEFFWHNCHFGRIYNNVTGLKKSLRQYLRVNNHQLVGCDVTNSQPLLVGLLCRQLIQGISLNNSLNSEFDHYLEINQEFLDRISLLSLQKQKEKGGEGHRNSLYDVGLTTSSQLLPRDLESYIQLCEEGKLYDELMLLDNHRDNRDKFKRQIFAQVFYGENCYEGRLTRLFAQNFPTVWETIRAIKKNDYKRLSHHMLRLESEIVINRAVRQCALEDIWVVTIHDCLVTFADHAERVTQIMTEAFGSVGVRPTIKTSDFN